MPAPTMTALARGGDPPEPPEGPRPRSFVTGPWPLARAGVSVMPLLPAYLLSPHYLPAPPGMDTAPPPALRTAGPVPRCAGPGATPGAPGWRLLDRDLLVDQAEVDALPPADDPRRHEDDDGQHVHRAHVVQRVHLVGPVEPVAQPFVEAVAEQPEGDHPGRGHDGHPEHLDLAGGRRGPQVRLAPRQDDD